MAEFAVEDLKDIQGTVLSGYAHLPCASYLFAQIADAAAAGDWLGRVATEVTTAAPWEVLPDGSKRKPQSALSIGLTFAGLQQLGLDIGDLDLVVQIDPPHTVSAFLQRPGRLLPAQRVRRWLRTCVCA